MYNKNYWCTPIATAYFDKYGIKRKHYYFFGFRIVNLSC